MSKSVDPDQTPRSLTFDLGLYRIWHMLLVQLERSAFFPRIPADT